MEKFTQSLNSGKLRPIYSLPRARHTHLAQKWSEYG